MASQLVQFSGLSDWDEQTLSLSPAAVSLVEILLARLFSGERVALLTEDQELSPTEASAIEYSSFFFFLSQWHARVYSTPDVGWSSVPSSALGTITCDIVPPLDVAQFMPHDVAEVQYEQIEQGTAVIGTKARNEP